MEYARNDRQAYFSGFSYTGEKKQAKAQSKKARGRGEGLHLFKLAGYAMALVVILAVVVK